MTLSELVKSFRRITGDKKGPFLWDNETVTNFLNDAVEEACVRKDLLFENGQNEALSHIPLIDDVRGYDIDPSFYKIFSAGYRQDAGSEAISLDVVGWPDVSNNMYNSTGTPKLCVVDDSIISVLPVPIGDTSTLVLSGHRVPIETEKMDFDDMDSSKPIISAIHHARLVHWAVYVAMSDVDLDSYSPDVAQRHLALFEAYFGERLSARRQQRNAQPGSRRNKIWL